jgi:hypothetical protein
MYREEGERRRRRPYHIADVAPMKKAAPPRTSAAPAALLCRALRSSRFQVVKRSIARSLFVLPIGFTFGGWAGAWVTSGNGGRVGGVGE